MAMSESGGIGANPASKHHGQKKPQIECLVTATALQARVQELGEELTHVYTGKCPIFLSILKGALTFTADLIRSVALNCKVDFLSISTYGTGQSSSGVVRVGQDFSLDVAGYDVILVEGLLDSGLTLNYLLGALREREPASLRVCCLLDKEKAGKRLVEVEPDFVGFTIPDKFVVGYGLDYEGLYRNLPALYLVEDISVLEGSPNLTAEAFR